MHVLPVCLSGGWVRRAGQPVVPTRLTPQVYSATVCNPETPGSAEPEPPPSTPPGLNLPAPLGGGIRNIPTSKALRFQMQNTSPEKAKSEKQ